MKESPVTCCWPSLTCRSTGCTDAMARTLLLFPKFAQLGIVGLLWLELILNKQLEEALYISITPISILFEEMEPILSSVVLDQQRYICKTRKPYWLGCQPFQWYCNMLWATLLLLCCVCHCCLAELYCKKTTTVVKKKNIRSLVN